MALSRVGRVSVPSSSGLRPDRAGGGGGGRGAFQFLLLQDFGRTCGGSLLRPCRCFSSFFFRISAGRRCCPCCPRRLFQFLLLQDFGRTYPRRRCPCVPRFSSFFFRTSAGQACPPSADLVMFQFLLLQDFGRTHVQMLLSVFVSFSSFFLRTSAGREGLGIPPYIVGFSSFFFRTSAGHTEAQYGHSVEVSVPSSSGLRPDEHQADGASGVRFQFLLLQDFCRTRKMGDISQRYVSVPSSSGLRPDGIYRGRQRYVVFQFLLLQDFGRTPPFFYTTYLLFVSVPSSSGLRPDGERVAGTPPGRFQFLLLQDFGRTKTFEIKRMGGSFSSFFFRTSAGPGSTGRQRIRRFQFLLLQDFGRTRPTPRGRRPGTFQFLLLQDFGRTQHQQPVGGCVRFQFLLLQDFGRTNRPALPRAGLVSVPSSSGLRPDRSGRVAADRFSFQFLLLQDFGRTDAVVKVIDCRCFSSFFFRTSAGQEGETDRLRPSCFSSFFFRTSAGRNWSSIRCASCVSVPSSSGLRPDMSEVSVAMRLVFQFLLLQDFGRTRSGSWGTRARVFQFLLLQDFGRTYEQGQVGFVYLFQFLLLQDFGRTTKRYLPEALGCFSSFFFRTSAGLILHAG